MSKDAAVALVNGWIKDFQIYLKDGGGAAGVHAKAKEALIERISLALASSPASKEPVKPKKKPTKPE